MVVFKIKHLRTAIQTYDAVIEAWGEQFAKAIRGSVRNFVSISLLVPSILPIPLYFTLNDTNPPRT